MPGPVMPARQRRPDGRCLGPGAGRPAGTPSRPRCSGAGTTRRTPPASRRAGRRRPPAGRAAAVVRQLTGQPARLTAGRAVASSAATRSASGSRAHRRELGGRLGSASTRAPISARSRPTASGAAAGPGPAGARRPGPPAQAARHGWSPPSRSPGLPGSSGRTCSASRALSRTTSIRRPASMLRYPAARSSPGPGFPAQPRRGHAGTRPAHRPRAPADRVVAPQLTYSWPSGNRPTDPDAPSAPLARSCRPRPCRRPPKSPGRARTPGGASSSPVSAASSASRPVKHAVYQPAAAGAASRPLTGLRRQSRRRPSDGPRRGPAGGRQRRRSPPRARPSQR